jgi:hypothetical protein
MLFPHACHLYVTSSTSSKKKEEEAKLFWGKPACAAPVLVCAGGLGPGGTRAVAWLPPSSRAPAGLAVYLFSFRQRTAIYLGGPRRLLRQPSRRCQGCEPSGQLFKAFNSMSPPPYGWCETTRSAGYDRWALPRHERTPTSTLPGIANALDLRY